MEVEIKYSNEYEKQMAYIENMIEDRVKELRNKLMQASSSAIQSNNIDRLIYEFKNDECIKMLQKVAEKLIFYRVPTAIIIKN